MQLRKKKDKIQQDAEFVQEDQVVLVETASQEDQEWVANQVVSVLKKRAKKNTKKTAKKKTAAASRKTETAADKKPVKTDAKKK